jgi:hypothetical protein
MKLIFICEHVEFENIQETNSALYSLRSGFSNEVSPFERKKNLGLVANFWEQIWKNLIRQNVGKEKQKSTCFGIFYKNHVSKLLILFQLKFPHCIRVLKYGIFGNFRYFLLSRFDLIRRNDSLTFDEILVISSINPS